MVKEGDYYLDAGAAYFSGQSVAYSLTASHVPGSTGVLESESNDTVETADALSLGTAMTGKMATGEDLDYFKFSVAGAGVLTLAFDLPIGFEDFDPFTLSLYDDKGVLLNSIANGVSQTYQTSLSKAGDYYLAVSATYQYDYSEGRSYSLKASHQVGPTAGFESEGNNSAAGANELTLGTAVTGQLASGEDVDFFKFAVTVAGLLTLDLDLPTDYDYDDSFSLGLYDTKGKLLNSYASGADKTFKTVVAQAGDYYLAVSAASSYDYSSDSYSLKASYAPGSIEGFESESNDTIVTANALSLGKVVMGQLSSYADIDAFKLKALSAGLLTLKFDLTNGSMAVNNFNYTAINGEGDNTDYPDYTDYSDSFNVRLVDVDGMVIASLSAGSTQTFQASGTQAGD